MSNTITPTISNTIMPTVFYRTLNVEAVGRRSRSDWGVDARVSRPSHKQEIRIETALPSAQMQQCHPILSRRGDSSKSEGK